MYGQNTARHYTLARTLDGIGVRLLAAAGLFLWFGWWTRQFWVSLALALGLTALLSWGYHIMRSRRRRPDTGMEGLAVGIHALSEEKLGDLVENIFESLPDFTHLYRTEDGLLAKVGHQAVLIGWDQPEKGRYTSIAHWITFLRNIREQKADRGILISGGNFDRECRLATQTCGKPRVELVDGRALARLASTAKQSDAVQDAPLLEQKHNPGWFQRIFYVLVRPGRCIFYAVILLIMARFFRIYAWYYFGAAVLLVAAAGLGIWMRYKNRRKWNPLLPNEERRYESSEYRSQRGS
jgi:uncharacterized protein (DUF486 family)